MVLDAFQAGLSWKTILHKREGFSRDFLPLQRVQLPLLSWAIPSRISPP
jgi:3-methyladenine DNA glycosylase Tag